MISGEKHIALVLSAALPLMTGSSALQAQTTDPVEACRAIYSGALTRLSTSERLSVAVQEIAEETCRADGSSIGASFSSKSQSIIQGIPIVGEVLGSLNITNTQQFCRAYASNSFNLVNVNRYVREPVVEAMQQANACLDIATRGILIRHTSLGPGTIVFSGTPTRPDTVIRLTTSFEPTEGWKCTSPKPNGRGTDEVARAEVRRDERSFEVTCTRRGQAAVGNGVRYPAGAVALNVGSAGSYTVRQRPDTMFGLVTANAAEEVAQDLQSRLQAAQTELTSVQAKLTASEKRRYTPVSWHYRDMDGADPDLFGQRYTCNDFREPDEQARNAKIARNQCIGGKLIGVQHVRVDPNCGGHSLQAFRGVCELPQ